MQCVVCVFIIKHELMSTESYISVLRSVCVCVFSRGRQEGRHTLKATLVAAALLAARRD